MVPKSFPVKLKNLFADKKLFTISGYVVAVIWFATSATLTVHAVMLPPPQIQILDPMHQEVTAGGLVQSPDTPVFEDLSSLRNPFINSLAPRAIVKKISSQDPYGIRVKAIIISSKNGAVLEDVEHGLVYFLSEGENLNGILIKSITKTGIKAEMSGQEITLPLVGDQR